MLEYQVYEESMQYADEYQNEINDYNPDNKKCQDLISSLQNQTAELSYSWMKEMLKSPAHFLAYKLKEYTPPNDSMIFGSMVDCLITEPANKAIAICGAKPRGLPGITLYKEAITINNKKLTSTDLSIFIFINLTMQK